MLPIKKFFDANVLSKYHRRRHGVTNEFKLTFSLDGTQIFKKKVIKEHLEILKLLHMKCILSHSICISFGKIQTMYS